MYRILNQLYNDFHLEDLGFSNNKDDNWYSNFKIKSNSLRAIIGRAHCGDRRCILLLMYWNMQIDSYSQERFEEVHGKLPFRYEWACRIPEEYTYNVFVHSSQKLQYATSSYHRLKLYK